MELTSLSEGFTTLSSGLRRSIGETSNIIAQLSSGERIQRARDDVAGMSVSTALTTRTTALRSAMRNLSQASSLLQVKDGALQQTEEMLQRMSAITTMAGSGSITNAERGFLQIEINQLQDEIGRVLGETNFNGVNLFVPQAEDTMPPAQAASAITSLADIKGLEQGIHTVSTGDGEFNGYVETYDNQTSGEAEEWLLIGRGREGWSFDQNGQGVKDDVTQGLGTAAAFDPKAWDAESVNSMLREAGLTMADVEFRIKRAADQQGDTYQEGRFRFSNDTTQFSWNFYNEINGNNNFRVNSGEWEIIDNPIGATFLDTVSSIADTRITPGADAPNDSRRLITRPINANLQQKGFSYGSNPRGRPDADNFIWDNSNNGTFGVPYTEFYIRIKDGVEPQTAEAQLDVFANDPRSIEGLAAWYDAADIDGDGLQEGDAEDGRTGTIVDVWKEKTGNGNNIIRQNGTGPRQTNEINGLDAVNVANGYRGQAADSLGGSTEEMHVFYVSRNNVASNNRLSLNGFNGHNGGTVDDNNRLWFLNWGDGRHFFDAGRSGNHRSYVRDRYNGNNNRDVTQVGDVTLTSGFVSVKEGQTGLSINGGEYTSRSRDVSEVFTQGGLRLGWAGQDQDYAEIMIFNRKLNSEEVARIEQYLDNKWSVSGFTHQGFDGDVTKKDANLTLDSLLDNMDVIRDVNNGVYTNATRYSLIGGGEAFDIDDETGELQLKDKTALLSRPSSITLQVTMQGGAFGDAPLTQDIVVDLSAYQNANKTQFIDFQIGEASSNRIDVEIANLGIDSLFGGAALSVMSAEDAAASFDVIQSAIDRITGERAETGAKQARVEIMQRAQESASINQQAANAVVADTDIARTSTLFAKHTVKNNMYISMQVQANGIRSDSILGLLSQSSIGVAPLRA